MSSTHVVTHPYPYSNALPNIPLVSCCHHHVTHQQHHPNATVCKAKRLQPMDKERRSPMLTDLSQELLELIFEQLRYIDLRCLRQLRCVSRQFSLIVTPIVYRSVELADSVVADDAEAAYAQVIDDIADFTNHVVIRSDLNPHGVKRLLAQISRLLTVRFRYVTTETRRDGIWLPEGLLTEEQRTSPKTQLFIENLPLREHIGGDDCYMDAIPVDILVSLKVGSPTPPLSSRVSALKHLILSCPKLEEFHYQDRGQGTRFRFDQGERMPALKNLVLKSYDWNHTRNEVLQHWDFSRLTSLEIISVPSFNFLKSVPFGNFANLRHLNVQDYSVHLPDRRYEATRELCTLVHGHIRALESLLLTCHVEALLLDSIIRHSASLQVLSLRDYVGFGDEFRRCPTIQPTSVSLIARTATRIHTLELDMDITRVDPRRFLRALSEFPRLTQLTLHVQTLVNSMIDEPASQLMSCGIGAMGDRDRDAAMQIFTALVSNRERRQPDMPPWLRITINVGGWRRVMIRRLSAAWRQLNERGIFAERCFVLRRLPDGLYSMREEESIETWSNRTTPEP